MKRTYTAEERQAALARAVEVGAYQAAKELGIHRSSLCRWMRVAGLATLRREKTQAATEARETRIAAKRAEGKELFADVIVSSLERARQKDTPAREVQHLTVSAATALDKLRLESGEVTSRDEHHNVTESELDHDIKTFLAEMAHREKVSAQGQAPLPAARLGSDSPGEAADAGGPMDNVADPSGPGLG